ncbi:MAG: CaiB/BaiF CoA-transferase family protein, partial [Pseudomonadota bacterium]
MHQRQRTGKGQQIDMALFDAAISITANQAMNFLATGTPPTRLGNYHPNLAPYQVFDCADGHMIVAVGNDGQFVKFCELMGLPELAEHPDYKTNPQRVRNRDALAAQFMEKTKTMSKAELFAACEAVGVPVGPINNMAEVFDDPQVKARGLQIYADGVPGVRTPIKFSDADLSLDHASPRLGEHD